MIGYDQSIVVLHIHAFYDIEPCRYFRAVKWWLLNTTDRTLIAQVYTLNLISRIAQEIAFKYSTCARKLRTLKQLLLGAADAVELTRKLLATRFHMQDSMMLCYFANRNER